MAGYGGRCELRNPLRRGLKRGLKYNNILLTISTRHSRPPMLLPSVSLTASMASFSSEYQTNAKPGGLRATHTYFFSFSFFALFLFSYFSSKKSGAKICPPKKKNREQASKEGRQKRQRRQRGSPKRQPPQRATSKREHRRRRDTGQQQRRSFGGGCYSSWASSADFRFHYFRTLTISTRHSRPPMLLPSISRTASVASLSSPNQTNAKPGGLRATHTCGEARKTLKIPVPTKPQHAYRRRDAPSKRRAGAKKKKRGIFSYVFSVCTTR